MPDDIKFLKYKTKILAVNTGDQPDRLTHDIVVPTFRGYSAGDRIPAGTLLSAIIEKEFNSTPPTPKVTITVVGNGTTSPAAGTHNVTYGGDFTLNSAVPATGYQLKDIVVDGETKTAPFTIRNITVDKTITVTFEEIPPVPKYTITTSAGANGSITPTFEVDEGANANVVITPNTDYVIDKITVDGTERDPISPSGETVMFSDVHEHHTVSATFKENLSPTVTLTIEAGMNGTVSPAGSRPVSRGSNVNQTLTASPGTGYEVDTWSLDNTVVQTGGLTYQLSLTNVQTNHEVLVTFKELPAEVYHIVIADATDASLSNYGTISPAVGTHDVAVGTDQAVVATPNTGFKIKSFTVDSTEQAISDPTQAFTYTVSGIAADATVNIIVEFEKIPTGNIYSKAYTQANGRQWQEPTATTIVLGDPDADTAASMAQIVAGTYSWTSKAQAKSIETFVIAKSVGRITSMKNAIDVEVLNNSFEERTVTIDGVDYWVYNNKSTVGAGNASYTLKGTEA